MKESKKQSKNQNSNLYKKQYNYLNNNKSKKNKENMKNSRVSNGIILNVDGKEVKRLDIRSDYVFKRIFADESNLDILKDFLQAILGIDIENIIIKNPELPKNYKEEKQSTLDLKVEVDKKMLIDIEVQVRNIFNMEIRTITYASKLINEQVHTTEDYLVVKKTITINILNYNLFGRNTYHSYGHLKFENIKPDEYVDFGFEQSAENVSDHLEVHFIELPKFRKYFRKKKTVDSKLEEWLCLFIGNERMINMIKEKNPKIKKVVEILDTMSLSERERWEYEERRMWLMDYNTAIISSRALGEKDGEKRGEKRGRLQGQKEVIQNLLKLGIPIEQICKAVTLPKSEVLKLAKKLQIV